MVTCFLFTHYLNEDGCLSLGLDQQGKVVAPLIYRNFEEIKALQKNAQTIIVAPTQFFSLHYIELPWLAERKARAAIPFALEDKLAQNVSLLHFAFDRHHYQHGRYLVTVCDKIYLTELVARLDKFNVNFDILTIDWFALKTNEIGIMETYILTNDELFQGALDPALANFYLSKLSTDHLIYSFTDSNPSLLTKAKAPITEIQDKSYIWLAQRLQQLKPMNLCQGELQHGSSNKKTKRWYQAAILMSLLWLISLIVINGIALYSLNKDIASVDAKIAAIYHEFFPEAKQVISPKFRISQLIKSKQTGTDSTFWILLNKLAEIFKTSSITLEQLRFQNQTLLVTLATKDFESLENLQNRLQQTNVKVKQTQASTSDEKVVSTLELNL